MAFRLAAERSERYAAIAAVAGHCWVEEPRPARRVPTLWMVGTEDPLAPLEGGTSVLPWEIRKSPPLRQTVARWCRANGYGLQPVSSAREAGVWIQDFGAREREPLFRLMLLDGHGHGWPGHPESDPRGSRAFYGPRARTVDATEVIWQFLRKQALPIERASAQRPARRAVRAVVEGPAGR
jgi:polyhydroxybutyrate depolymerase